MTQITDKERGGTFYRLQVCLGRYTFLDKYGKDMESFYDMVTIENIQNIVKTSLINIQEWKQKESLMGRVSDWLIEMEEDAGRLSRYEWIAKHGSARISIWDKANDASDQEELEL